MKNIKKFVKVALAMNIAVMLGTSQPVEAASDTVVIYEVFGGGGNSGATYKNDYIVLKNISKENQSLDGLFVHRGSSNAWHDSIGLSGTLKPGQYYLIEAQEGFNKDAKSLPRVSDVSAPKMGIGGKNFSIALTRDDKTPSSSNTIDLLGAGTSILNESLPSEAAANNIAIRRINDVDTDNNANDFETISLNETSLDYLGKDNSTSQPDPESIPEESIITIDSNGGEVEGLEKNKVVKQGETYTFPWNIEYYKDGYHFDGFDVEGELFDSNGNKLDYIEKGHANPIYNYTAKSNVTLKVRWKVMQGGQFKAYLKRDDESSFGGQDYKLYLKGTDSDERKFPYGVTREAQTHKMSLLQLKNDTYTLRVEGLEDNEYIKEVRLNQDKYTQNQATTSVEIKDREKVDIDIKYDSHFIAPEVSFDVIIGKEAIKESYTLTLNGEGINEITVPGFTRDTEINLKSVGRDGFNFKGWNVEGTLYDAEGRPVTGLITNFDQAYYPGSDVVFTAVWEEALPEVVDKPNLIIYEVFGGGGKTGSLYANDYVVIKNLGDTDVSLDGMVLRRGFSNRWTDQTVALSGEVAPGAYYVVSGGNDKETDGGQRLVPSVNLADENFNLANRTFALALTSDSNIPSEENTIDLVGTGKAINFEGKQAATGRNNVSLRRINDGQDTDNNREDFGRVEHIRDADEYPLAYLGDKDERVAVTFEFNKVIDGVKLPEAQKVEVGSELTLPEVSPEVKDGYSFLGWSVNGSKYSTPNLKSGDQITVTEDTNIMGIWEGAYGKVSLTFHENEFIDNTYENRSKINKIENLEGFGFTVTNQQTGDVTAGKKSNYKGQISISNGLVKGLYTLNVTAPEGYEIVRIARNTGSNGVIEIDNGSTISLPRPEAPFNLTMVDSIYVEVKEKEKQPVSVTYTTNKKVTGLTLPENQELMPGTEITLPAMEKVLKAGRGLEQFEYYLINGEKKQPGDKVVINEDTEITAYYEFYNYSYTANIYLADEEGKPGTKLKDASGFVVKAGDVESVQSKNYPSNLNVGPLLPGTYDISVEIPEGYELVNILDYYNNPVTTETRPVGAESTTTSRLLKVVVREKAPEVQLPEELYIYEIYGGGGFSDTYYANDYIILQNKSNNDINLDGMYLHITDQWQNNWVNSVPLTGTIKANDYFVIQGAVSYGTDHDGKYGLYQPLPRVDQAINVNIPTEAFATAITMGPDAPAAPYTNDSANVIDLVGTYNNNKIYWQSKASSPSLSISSRRVAYTDNNSVDFTFRYGANPNSKINHREYIEGKAEHKEPLWYLRDTQEEKITITFEHKSDADDFVLQNNQVPAEKKVWSETTIRLPEVNAEDNYNFLGWDIDGDGQADKQAGDDLKVTSNMTITGIWESLKPQKQTINFVVDSEKATATGSLFVEIDEGEDALSYAPELTVKEGYEFIKWQPSEDGLTYTAVFEEAKKADPEINYSYNVVITDIKAGLNTIKYRTMDHESVVVIVNGIKFEQEPEVVEGELYHINLPVNLKSGDKIQLYITKDNQISKPIKQRI